MENEQILADAFFMPVKPISTTWGTLKDRQSDVSTCALIHVENILRIRSELCLDKQLDFSSFSIQNVYCKCFTWGFGGLEIACWALVPKFAGSNPTEAVGFFRVKKILSTPSFGGEVKPSVPCRRFTACKRSLNVTWKSGIFRQIHWSFIPHVVPPLAARISWRRPVAKVGTFENKKVHKHLHLWPLGPHRRRLAVRSGTSKGSAISQYGCSTFGALATEGQ